jgi:hypothetical protein
MGLLRIALIFGAGYALGRPEGRRKLADLAQRPEVKQAREQAMSTVSSGLETGKQRISGKVSEVSKARGKNKEPSFPERGARPDDSSLAAAGVAPPATTPGVAPATAPSPGTASNASSPVTPTPGTASPSPTSTGTSSGTTSTGTRSTGTRSTGTGNAGIKPAGTSTDPDVPSSPPSSAR